MEPIKFERQFEMWHYTVSHRQLLLRSVKSSQHPTRIDMLFKGVAALGIPSSFPRLEIAQANEEAVSALAKLHGAHVAHLKMNLYSLVGGEFLGYVAALGAFFHEDGGEYDDPSFFFSKE